MIRGLIVYGLQFVTCKNQAFDGLNFYTFTNSKMQNLTTWDLGTLENSFEFLEDLPRGDIWNVELEIRGDIENFYFRSEKNAKNKFDELVKKHGLRVSWNHARNFWITVWMGKICFDD